MLVFRGLKSELRPGKKLSLISVARNRRSVKDIADPSGESENRLSNEQWTMDQGEGHLVVRTMTTARLAVTT